ncbi:hypothetical protein [Streptomyces sp. NPDC002685]|uniref:hypothetical protein n=1 Tax=Streptomyces sp. NPDC002685 TaxID=3154540 RepID=UPI0033325052
MGGDFGDLGAEPERVGEHLTSLPPARSPRRSEEVLEQVAAGDDVDEPVFFVDHRE